MKLSPCARGQRRERRGTGPRQGSEGAVGADLHRDAFDLLRELRLRSGLFAGIDLHDDGASTRDPVIGEMPARTHRRDAVDQ